MMVDLLSALTVQADAGQPQRQKPLTSVSWHACDLRTGVRGAPVSVVSPGTVSVLLSSPAETSLDVVIWDRGQPLPNWEASTQPGAVMLVAVDQNDDPIWGGMVYRRAATLGTSVNLNLITLEGYLDRRYVDANYTWTGADQSSDIAAGMIQDTLATGVLFNIDAPMSNFRRNATYLVDDDKTILSVLEELSGQLDGIEYSVDMTWTDDSHTVLSRTIRIRNRLGTAYLGLTGVQSDNPPAVFQYPGHIIDMQYVEDYSADHGANAVLATSSGEGDSRPESLLHIAGPTVVAGWGGSMPMFEMRFTPAESISDHDTLDQHAFSELLQTWQGLKELTLTVQMDDAPQVNVDWYLGDDVGVVMTCPRFPPRVGPDGVQLPGYVGVLRVTGYDIDLAARQVKPRLTDLTETQVITA